MKRPRGVTIISCLLLVQGLVGILTVGLIVTVGALALAHRLATELLPSFGATSVVGWAGAGAYVLVALLAWFGWRGRVRGDEKYAGLRILRR